jgi:hypothetical protein
MAMRTPLTQLGRQLVQEIFGWIKRANRRRTLPSAALRFGTDRQGVRLGRAATKEATP